MEKENKLNKEILTNLVESLNESEEKFKLIRELLPGTIKNIKQLDDIDELRWAALNVCGLWVMSLEMLKTLNDSLKESTKLVLGGYNKIK